MDEPTAARQRPARRIGRSGALVLAFAAGLVIALVVVSSASGSTRPRLLVVGDGAVDSARTEIARRFRQEGEPVDVRVVGSTECADLTTFSAGYQRVVVSFGDWSGCGPWPAHVVMLVEQPGAMPVGAGVARGVTVRPVSTLFDGDPRVPCAWWDTPGAGEQVPGLGACEPDGKVTVLDGAADPATLTPAGDERFARMIVESVS